MMDIKNHDGIVEAGETHDNLIKDDFDTILSSSNSAFHRHIEIQQTKWETGKDFTFTQLSLKERTTCNNKKIKMFLGLNRPEGRQDPGLSNEIIDRGKEIEPGASTFF